MNLTVITRKLYYKNKFGIQTDGAFSIQMDALAAYCDKLTLCVPVISDLDFRGLGQLSENIHFHTLPPFLSRREFLFTTPVFRKKILEVMQETDIALVILPGYFGVFASYLCQKAKFPVFHWVVSDWSSNIIARRRGIKAFAALIFSFLINLILTRLTRDVLTFFNGRILYGKNLKHHHTRNSSSITVRDIHFSTKADRDLSPPFRLLFVGRLSPEKGISYLLQAVASLENRDQFQLSIIGKGQLLDELILEAKSLGIERIVNFLGYIPHGHKLLSIFRNSDIFVLPAIQDQQPKVLMEAMAQGLPVIATDVGGIPSIITNGHNGLLVPRSQPEALAEAIQRLLIAKERIPIIKNGLSFVRKRTVEIETEKMMRIVRKHFLI